jgi:hypothetical protein
MHCIRGEHCTYMHCLRGEHRQTCFGVLENAMFWRALKLNPKPVCRACRWDHLDFGTTCTVCMIMKVPTPNKPFRKVLRATTPHRKFHSPKPLCGVVSPRVPATSLSLHPLSLLPLSLSSPSPLPLLLASLPLHLSQPQTCHSWSHILHAPDHKLSILSYPSSTSLHLKSQPYPTRLPRPTPRRT